jgi:hypothetical protein
VSLERRVRAEPEMKGTLNRALKVSPGRPVGRRRKVIRIMYGRWEATHLKHNYEVAERRSLTAPAGIGLASQVATNLGPRENNIVPSRRTNRP